MRATISVEDKTSRIQHVEGGYTFPPFVVMHRGETIKHLAQQEDATRTVIISVRLPASPALPCPALPCELNRHSAAMLAAAACAPPC